MSHEIQFGVHNKPLFPTFDFCSSKNSTLLPCCAALRLSKRLIAQLMDSSTEGDPCLLKETLHLQFFKV
jgi:hypothetical protein